MVLNFAEIPLHLQIKIVEKTDVWDLKNFKLSSKLAHKILNLTVIMPILEVPEIVCLHSDVLFKISHPYFFASNYMPFGPIADSHDSPRLAVDAVTVTDDAGPEIIKILTSNSVKILGGEIRLHFFYNGAKKLNVEAMENLAACFKIRCFASDGDVGLQTTTGEEGRFFSTPLFKQLEKFYCRSFLAFPNDAFLKLTANSIHLRRLETFPEDGRILNTFFKQCILNQRKITEFRLEVNPSDPSMQPRELFYGLNYKLIWSKQIHDSSQFARVPEGIIGRFPANQEVYLITGGGKKIAVCFGAVLLLPNILLVQEVRDEIRFVLSLPAANALPGSILYA